LSTHAPSPVPTTSDTVSVSVEFALSASSAPTDLDISNLKTTVATQTGVAISCIQSFTVTATISRRRRLLDRRLTSYTWSVSFNVMASLASVGFSDSSSFATSVITGLADVANQASTDLGIALVLSNPVTAIIVTREPSPAPTSIPSKRPSVTASDSATTISEQNTSPSAASMASLPVMIGVATGGFCFLFTVSILLWRIFRTKDEHADEIDFEKFEEENEVNILFKYFHFYFSFHDFNYQLSFIFLRV
jgi:hypothetical protein